MSTKILSSVLAGALLGILVLASTVESQDFNGLLAQAASTTQTYVSQIESAQSATDLASLQARARTALATGNQLISTLNSAQAIAPNDADRSRASGLIAHVQAAQASLQAALNTTDLTVARSALEAARAEAVEALSEVKPFAAQTPTQVATAAPVTATATVVPTATAAVVAPKGTVAPSAMVTATTTPIAQTLPVTGDPGLSSLLPLAGAGLALAALGAGLRRRGLV